MIKGLKIQIDPTVEKLTCGLCGQLLPWREFVILRPDGFFISFRYEVKEPEKLTTGDLTEGKGWPVCNTCKQKHKGEV